MTALASGRPPVAGSSRRGFGRRLLPVLVAILLAVPLGGTVGLAPARAASDELRLAVAATYRVDPAKRAVHVTLDGTATNLAPDTATALSYFDAVSFAVPLEAKGFSASSGGSKLAVATKARQDFRQVTISFPRLYHGKTRTIRLTFDLPSGKPRSDSPVRVGQAHTAFTAWAWGDPGLGDVRIVMPPHFIADVETIPTDAAAQLVSRSVDGRTEYTVSDLADPLGWYSWIEGSNRDALTDVSITVSGEPLVIHAWPEDDEWLERVTTVLEDSLPDLEAAIGLPWPVSRDLEVTEVTATELEGYAGFFDSSYDEITISEDLDDLVIVHEAAHAWFDGSLFQERWIDEGLADEYAARILAADHPDRERESPSPVAATDAAAFALNTWRPPDRIDAESAAYEKFGYDASWTVMRAIVEDVTEQRMRDVFRAAAAQTLTYAGAGPAERSGFVPDWRRFLDLVTDVGGSTGAEDLLETWALTPKEAAELDARDAARTRYFALVEAGDGWLPGVLVRKPMSNWRFADADIAMAEAETVISGRDALETATTDLGLSFPAGLESVYESADATDDLTGLDSRIADWTAAAAAIRTARDGLAEERPPLVELGLLDTDPSTGYKTALAAFAAGDDKAVLAGTAVTIAALAGAEEIGRGRATMAGVAVGITLLLLVALAVVLIRRRRRRPAVVPTWPAAVAWASATGPGAPAAPAAPVVSAPASWAADVPPPPVGLRRLDDLTPQPSVAAPPVAASPPGFDATDVPPPPVGVRRLDADPPPTIADGPGFAPEDPYATLAATPDLVEGTDAGAPRARGAEPD